VRPSRFNRDYALTVQAAGVAPVIVKPPMRVSFDASKSISGGLNKITVRIYNLKQANRLALVKDVEDFDKRIPLSLSVGYEDTLQRVYRGTVHRGRNTREGPDHVTELEGLDGGFDYLNSFTSKTVRGKDQAIGAILDDMPNTGRGKLTSARPLIRPRVLVGASALLIDDLLDADETWYIDDEKLYTLKADEVTSSFIPVVNAATGLLDTPTRDQFKISFDTLMNPTLKPGGLFKLQSVIAPHLDGVYKIETIGYAGDNYGDKWGQTVTGILAPEYAVI
jgi:hypothetical protein